MWEGRLEINPVVLEFNWKSWYEFIVIHRKHTVNKCYVSTYNYFLNLSIEKA